MVFYLITMKEKIAKILNIKKIEKVINQNK